MYLTCVFSSNKRSDL